MTITHFQKLRNMYLGTKVNTQIFDTTECKIELEKATISLTISDKYFHALGAIHGAVYFKLLDDAAYFAAQSVIEDAFLLTSTFQTNIIRPANKGKITSVGKIRSQSKNLIIGEATIYNEAGKEIAFGTGHFMRSKIELTEEIGYK